MLSLMFCNFRKRRYYANKTHNICETYPLNYGIGTTLNAIQFVVVKMVFQKCMTYEEMYGEINFINFIGMPSTPTALDLTALDV